MYPFLYPFVQRPYFLRGPLFRQWTLPLKHAEASRCGVLFSRSHGTGLHDPSPASE